MTFSRDQVIGVIALGLFVAGCAYGAAVYRPQKPVVADCASLVSTDEDIPLPVSCGFSLGEEEAVLTVTRDGTLTVSRASRVLLTLYAPDESREGDSLTFDASGLSNDLVLAPGALSLVDVNFDGYLDLRVREWTAAYQSGYDFYFYELQTGAFDRVPLLKRMGVAGTEAYFDPMAREISVFHKGRGIADLYAAETYRFIDGVYVLVKRISQDFRGEATDTYVYREEERVNGELRVIKEEIRSREEVSGE